MKRTIDAIRVASPDVLLIAPCGYGVERAASEGRALLGRVEWAWARERSVWAVDANTVVSRPGSRLAEGIVMMARIFHPSLFSPLGTGRAVRLM